MRMLFDFTCIGIFAICLTLVTNHIDNIGKK